MAAKHVVSTSLIILYGLLAIYSIYQLWIIFREKHKKTGYKAFFHYFTVIWGLIRSIFWLTFVIEITINQELFFLMFWLPQAIQYTTFALLAVFLIKVIIRRQWSGQHGYRNLIFLCYGLSTGAYFLGTIIVATLAAQAENNGSVNGNTSDYFSNIQSLGSAMIFFFLALVFAIIGVKLCGLPSWEYNRMFLFQPKIISSVASIICAVFTSRSIFNFLTFAKVIDIDIDRDDVVTDVSAAAVYFVWEFFPILLLLTTIAAGPKGLRYRPGKDGISIAKFGVFSAISEHDDDINNNGLEVQLSPDRSLRRGNNSTSINNNNMNNTTSDLQESLLIHSSNNDNNLHNSSTSGIINTNIIPNITSTPRKTDTLTSHASLRGLGASGGLVVASNTHTVGVSPFNVFNNRSILGSNPYSGINPVYGNQIHDDDDDDDDDEGGYIDESASGRSGGTGSRSGRSGTGTTNSRGPNIVGLVPSYIPPINNNNVTTFSSQLPPISSNTMNMQKFSALKRDNEL